MYHCLTELLKNRNLKLLLRPIEGGAAPLPASLHPSLASAATWKECGTTGYHGYLAPQVLLFEQEMGSTAACHSTKAKHCVKTKWSVNPNKLWVVSSITLIGPGFELPLEYHYCMMEGCEQEECERGKSVKTHCGCRHFTLENKHAHSHTLARTWLKNYLVCHPLTHTKKTCWRRVCII